MEDGGDRGQQQSSLINSQVSSNHHSSIIIHQSSFIIHQSSIINHQFPIPQLAVGKPRFPTFLNHQSSFINHQFPPLSLLLDNERA